jgi:hypothetical protein
VRFFGTAGMAITGDTTPRVESPAPAPSVKDPYAELREEPGFISRDDLGEQWPLTVDAGVLSCESHGGGVHSVFFTDPEGKRYALNGIAEGHHPELPPIDQILAPNPKVPELKINIGPLIDRGPDGWRGFGGAACRHRGSAKRPGRRSFSA